MEALDSNGSRKRKLPGDSEFNQESVVPKHPLLESVGQRFQLQRDERLQKMQDIKAHCQQERSHSAHLKQNVAAPQEMASAAFAVSTWVKKNALNCNKRAGNSAWLETVRQNEEKAIASGSYTQPVFEKTTAATTSGVASTTATAASTTATRASTTANAIERFAVPSATATRASTPITREEIINISVSDDIIDITDTADHSIILLEDDGNEVASQQQQHTCPILSCGAEFSSDARLRHHMNEFDHSPCNPCQKIVDCKPNSDPLCYLCSVCYKEFQSREMCAHHIIHEKHLSHYPPFTVQAYLCPQCLCLFNSYGSCWQHIDATSHTNPALPFQDDLSRKHDRRIAIMIDPIPVNEELLQDYLQRCASVRFKVQCLECDFEPENPAMLKHHMDETKGRHVISSLTESSLMDVFDGYMTPYCCSYCKRLCTEQQRGDGIHVCADRVFGSVVRNTCSSFKEFVIRCGLTLTKSLPAQNNPRVSPVIRTDSTPPVRRYVPAADTAAAGPSSHNVLAPPPQQVRPRSRTRSRSGDRMPSPCDLSNKNIVSCENLSTMISILFLDLDNWPGFFSKLPKCLPHKTFVWGFHGGGREWFEPTRCFVFNEIKRTGCFYLHERCGRTKDAADFAIVLTVGKMDAILPKGIPFTIVSGDTGFYEVERQMKDSGRKAIVVNPHSAQKVSNYTIYTMVTSVADT